MKLSVMGRLEMKDKDMNNITDQEKTEKIQSVGEKVSILGIVLFLILFLDLKFEFMNILVSNILIFSSMGSFILGAVLQKSSYNSNPIII